MRRSTESMKATIIIPNINGKGWLKDSIESVYAQTEQDFELIVVDNGSTDESLEQARSYCSRPNFHLIENGSNTGFSHAVNQGIARAKSEFVVLFNNDAFAEPQWLAELIRVAESDEKIFAVQSLMIRHFDRELADDAGDYVTWMGFACKTGDGRRASRAAKASSTRSASSMKTFLPTSRTWTSAGAPTTPVTKTSSALRQSATTSAAPAPARCGTTPSRASRAAATASFSPSRTSLC